MHEQLQTIIASYFKYWGPEVAEMLSKVGDYVTQRQVVNEFMRIIEEHLWQETDYTIEIRTELAEDIKQPVTLFVKLYYLDKLAEETLQEVRESLLRSK